MSKDLSKVRVFTDAAFKNAGKVERMYIHMMNPEFFMLTDTEASRLEQLKDCFALVNHTVSPTEQIRLILETIREIDSWEMANKLKNEMEQLFGDIVTRNRDYTRTLYINKLRELSVLAERDEDYAEARRCIVAAAKLDHMDLPEQQKFDPEMNKIPKAIFTNDISDLEIEEAEEV